MKNKSVQVWAGFVSAQKRGITLIQLVITIVILLILVCITINLTMGKNGIFGQKEHVAKQQTTEDDIDESELRTVKFTQRIMKINKNDVDILVIIEDEKNGIKEVVKPDGVVLSINNKTKVAIDYKVEDGKEYIFDITNGKGIVKKGVVNLNLAELTSEPLGDIELFTKMEESNHNINDLYMYGVTVDRSGKNEYGGMNQLHSLGMGSSAGINTNIFTLTIDFDTLATKYGMNKNSEGISVDYVLGVATTHPSYTSWVGLDMIVLYEDGKEDRISGKSLVATNETLNIDSTLTSNFVKDKTVKQIQLIITMYDSDYGNALGYIRNITILEAMSEPKFDEEEIVKWI